jgi:hypothetical protein
MELKTTSEQEKLTVDTTSENPSNDNHEDNSKSTPTDDMNDSNPVQEYLEKLSTENNYQYPTSSDPKNKKFNPENYVQLMSIGNGNFSEVFMVEHVETKVLYSLKMFTKRRIESLNKQEDVLMEKHVMEKIEEHDNIIKYYGSNKDEVNK